MKFTWIHVLCLVVVGASAQSFHSGFRLNNFNSVNGRCDNGFGVQNPVIETARIHVPNFVAPAIARPGCDCVKAVVRPQVKKEIIPIPSVQRLFQTPSNTIIHTVPFVGARNIQIPAFPLPSLKVFTEVISAPMVDTRSRIFSRTSVNIGSSTTRSAYGLDGNFHGISNGAFLGNALGACAELVGSLPAAVGSGFSSRCGGTVLPRSSVVCGFTNGEFRNRC